MTDFTETRALVLAMEDVEADSGNHDPLDAYLRENFLPGELRRLSWACGTLEDAARRVRRELEMPGQYARAG